MTRPAGQLACVAVAIALLAATPARADDDVASRLREANDALQISEFQRAADLAGPISLMESGLDPADRAEAWRVSGLALFFLHRLDEAEAALLEYLHLDVDAHLDPGGVPPEAIIFFEDLRSRYAAELRGYRVRPATPREWAKNLFPPWGQIQNGHKGRAWFLGTSTVVLLGANITSWALLRRWCDKATGVCRSGQTDRDREARQLRRVNLVSGALLIGIYAYGVIDGFLHHRRLQRMEARPMSVGVLPARGGGRVAFRLHF